MFTAPPVKLAHGFRDTMAKCMRMSYLKHGVRLLLIAKQTHAGSM